MASAVLLLLLGIAAAAILCPGSGVQAARPAPRVFVISATYRGPPKWDSGLAPFYPDDDDDDFRERMPPPPPPPTSSAYAPYDDDEWNPYSRYRRRARVPASHTQLEAYLARIPGRSYL